VPSERVVVFLDPDGVDPDSPAGAKMQVRDEVRLWLPFFPVYSASTGVSMGLESGRPQRTPSGSVQPRSSVRRISEIVIASVLFRTRMAQNAVS
jgi:hypothetical protein